MCGVWAFCSENHVELILSASTFMLHFRITHQPRNSQINSKTSEMLRSLVDLRAWIRALLDCVAARAASVGLMDAGCILSVLGLFFGIFYLTKLRNLAQSTIPWNYPPCEPDPVAALFWLHFWRCLATTLMNLHIFVQVPGAPGRSIFSISGEANDNHSLMSQRLDERQEHCKSLEVGRIRSQMEVGMKWLKYTDNYCWTWVIVYFCSCSFDLLLIVCSCFVVRWHLIINSITNPLLHNVDLYGCEMFGAVKMKWPAVVGRWDMIV